MKNIKLYCDGGCRGNGKKNALGAWAYVIIDEKDVIIDENSLAVEGTTNIQMEMTAMSEGLKAIAMATEIEDINKLNVFIYTDSKFICDCFNLNWIDSWIRNNWKKSNKQPVANQNLWELLIALESMFAHVDYIYCPGHSGIKFNEYCDKKVNETMDKYLKEGR